MSQASEYIINKALGKPPNPENVKITEIPKVNGNSAWVFPDGSRMYHESGQYIEYEEVK